jgi:hypothetical protein
MRPISALVQSVSSTGRICGDDTISVKKAAFGTTEPDSGLIVGRPSGKSIRFITVARTVGRSWGVARATTSANAFPGDGSLKAFVTVVLIFPSRVVISIASTAF